MRRGMRSAMAAAALATATPAQAAWLKATSRHFIVYADDSETSLRAQATALESYDALLRRFQGLSENPDAEFNRVTVYVLPTIAAVEKLSGEHNVAGFYIPRVTGSIAFTPRPDRMINGMNAPVVLLHEYTHHFMLGNTTAAYPAWFTEGYAEFASSVTFSDGVYYMGAADQQRAYSLKLRSGDLSARELFAPPETMGDWQEEALYARGWVLTHMVEFDPALRAAFNRYLVLLNTGTPGEKAATTAFGDLGALDHRMAAYAAQKSLPALPIRADTLPTPSVEVHPLGAGQAALIQLRIESTRGVDTAGGKPLWARARRLASACAGDAVAQGWLAEMAFDAGDLAAAEAAADAALAIDSRSVPALLYKARVRMMRLEQAKSSDAAAWTEARSWILAANRAQPNDAAALELFYQSFGRQGVAATRAAVAGLYRAVDLEPEYPGTRWEAARVLLQSADVAGAKAMLRPLAYDPHAGADNPAARVLKALNGGADGRTALALLDAPAKAGRKPH